MATQPPTPSPAWGSTSGLLSLSPASPTDEDADAARLLIAERINCYAWSFDERRADLLADCFTDNAVWHGNLRGMEPVPPIHGRDEIVSWLCAFWDRQTDQRRHMLMSVEIDELTPTNATAVASLLLTSVEAELKIALTSFYQMRLVRHNGEWLIDNLFEGGDVPF